jgi:predicted MarR family transcription regulator
MNKILMLLLELKNHLDNPKKVRDYCQMIMGTGNLRYALLKRKGTTEDEQKLAAYIIGIESEEDKQEYLNLAIEIAKKLE